jgi:hypothetical protein
MKKVIKLTESDLVRIVKRVINESKKNPHPNKGIVYDGVKISTVSPSGGPVYLTYKGKKLKYTIKVSVKKLFVELYNGPIAVVSLWTEPGVGYFVEDNTGKKFKLETSELQKMVNAAKNNDKEIYFAGTGEIGGIEGNYNATMTKIV